jgi:hypothetical protein
VARQDITGPDRPWAAEHDRDDVVRDTTGSQLSGLRSGQYARVDHINADQNRLTVVRQDGDRVTYDPAGYTA